MALIDDIAGIVGDALVDAGMSKPATLTQWTAGTRDPNNLSGGTVPTSTAYAAQGLVISWRRQFLNATEVQATDRVVMLYGSTVAGGAVPKVSDQITIEGVTSRIIDIERDAAAATYRCLTRA